MNAEQLLENIREEKGNRRVGLEFSLTMEAPATFLYHIQLETSYKPKRDRFEAAATTLPAKK